MSTLWSVCLPKSRGSAAFLHPGAGSLGETPNSSSNKTPALLWCVLSNLFPLLKLLLWMSYYLVRELDEPVFPSGPFSSSDFCVYQSISLLDLCPAGSFIQATVQQLSSQRGLTTLSNGAHLLILVSLYHIILNDLVQSFTMP